jgi:hypothetical protein
MSRFNFNEPYEFAGLEPQEVRLDFADYMIETCQNLDDAEKLIYALAGYISTDQLGQFLDDRMMGRV